MTHSTNLICGVTMAEVVNSCGSSIVMTVSCHPFPPCLSDVSSVETAGLGASCLAADIAVAMKGRHFFSDML